MRVDKTGHDRHVAEIEVALPLAGRAHPGDSSVLDRDAAVLDRRASTGKTYRAWRVSVSRLIGRVSRGNARRTASGVGACPGSVRVDRRYGQSTG